MPRPPAYPKRNPSGTWFGMLEVGTDSYGNRKRRRVTFEARNLTDARAKWANILAQHARGEITASLRVSVADYIETHLESARDSWARSTYDRNQRQFARHIIPKLGGIQLQKLTPMDVQRWINALISEGLAAGSVVRLHAILRSALEDAVKQRMIPWNPAVGVRLPTVSKMSVAKVLTPEQVEEALTFCKGGRMYLPVLLAVSLALRPGECLGLQWDDIDLEEGSAIVRRSVTSAKGEIIIKPPKDSEERILPLPDRLWRRLVLEYPQRKSEWVCVDAAGRMVRPSYLSHAWHKIIKQTGLPECRFYDLRHTCASWLTADGVPLPVVQMILGHSSIKTTTRYTHVDLLVMREALRKVTERLEDDGALEMF